MATLDDIRKAKPEYAVLNDRELANRVYAEFYSDMPRQEFNQKIGYAPEATNDPGFIDNLGRNFAQGASAGFADEFAAGADATLAYGMDLGRSAFGGPDNLSWRELYDTAIQNERGIDQRFMDENPLTATGMQLAGGIAGAVAGVGLAPKVAAVAPRAAQAFTSLPRWAQFGIAGGVGGGVASFGSGTGGFEERMTGGPLGGTLGGTAIGAGMGVTMPAIVNALAKGGKAAIPWVMTQLGVSTAGPRDVFMRKLLQSAQRDQITVDELIANLERLGPEAGIVDAGGENVLSLGRSVAARPGPTQNIASRFFNERQAGQGERVLRSVTDNMTGGDPRFYSRIDELMAQRKVDAKPLYDIAYAQPVLQGDDLTTLLQRPSMQQAMNRALRIAREEGRDPTQLGFDFNEAGDVIFTREPSWQTLDYVKRGVDDVLNSLRDPLTGKLRLDESGRAIDATRREFVGMLRQNNPAYAQALDAWGGPSHAIDVMNRGRDFIKGDADALARRLDDLSDADREIFRIGAAQELKSMIEGTRDNVDLFGRLYGTKAMRDKLALVFPDQEALARFAQTIQTEHRFSQNRNIAAPRSGSKTNPSEIADADLAIDPNALVALLDSAQQGNVRGVVRSGVDLLRNGVPPSQRVADAGGAMFSGDQAANRALLESLRSQQAQQMLARGPQGDVMGFRGLLSATQPLGLLGAQ